MNLPFHIPASEQESLMQDARDTVVAANAYADAHKGFLPPRKDPSSLGPYLPTGSQANVARFVLNQEGQRPILTDDLPPLGEFGHYEGKTGTAIIDDAGKVYWWAKGKPRPSEVFEPRSRSDLAQVPFEFADDATTMVGSRSWKARSARAPSR